MTALLLGLVAALAWGVHDICVRYVSQRIGILPALCTVLASGAVMLVPLTLLYGEWSGMSVAAYGLSAASGLVFAGASIGLYKAFGIGPVRLVAPIIGAYPILSLGWSALGGAPVGGNQWLAVLVVIAGIGIVAALTDGGESGGSKRQAVLWSLVGGVGFAVTFALGHAASRAGAELPVIISTRAAAVVVVFLLVMVRRQAFGQVRAQLPILLAMGALDATALGIVLAAGTLPNAAFAAVGASLFGMVTILLAWAFLSERMTAPQWGGVLVVFAGLGYLAL